MNDINSTDDQCWVVQHEMDTNGDILWGGDKKLH